MPTTFLDYPFSPGEDRELHFESAVTLALSHAYRLLKQHDYQGVLAALAPVQDRAMSDRQLVRVRYALGFAATQRRALEEASVWLDDALERAPQFDDAGAIGILAALRGTTHYYLNNFRGAATYYRISLDAWHVDEQTVLAPSRQDLTFEVEALTQLGTQEFWLDHPKTATALLLRAQRLGSQLPDAERPLARIAWMLALSSRWRRRLESARQYGMAALEVYERLGAPTETARLRLVVADILIDTAKAMAPAEMTSMGAHWLTLAQPHLLHALAQTRLVGDEPGAGMATLAYVRYLQVIQDTHVDRWALIDSVAHTAERLHDRALLGQALNVQGDELASYEGGEDAARVAYAQALDVFATGGVPGLGVWARRALLRAEEPLKD